MVRERTRMFEPTQLLELWTVNGIDTRRSGSYGGGFETITDLTHDLSSLGKGDQGGPMVLQRDHVEVTPAAALSGFGKGSTVCIRPAAWADSPSQPYNSTLWPYGGTAIARTLPTNPVVNIGESLAESLNYRQAVPRLLENPFKLKGMLEHFRSLGRNYLSVEFGWLPFIRDLHDVCKVIIKSDEYIQKLKNGSGHKTRKGYHFPDYLVQLNPSPTSLYSVSSELSGWDAGPLNYQGTYTEKTWFEGCYTYTVPFANTTIDNSNRFRIEAEYLLGLRPTLEMVWAASPWSWMVDWVLNTGDVARNISAFARDSLFLNYGYIMRHSRIEERYWSFGADPITGGPIRCTAANTHRVSEWKVRYPASPYGFGITYDGLNDTQKLILASIGITHF